MSLFQTLLHRSVHGLVRLASGLTLVGLAIMVYSVLVPRALPVMLALSVGHAVGIAGFACFFLAVVIDAARVKPRPSRAPVEVESSSPGGPPSSGRGR